MPTSTKTKERNSKIVGVYNEGVSIPQIAKRFKLTQPYVNQILIKEGVTSRVTHASRAERRKKVLAEAKKMEKDAEQLAKKFKLTPAYVRLVCREAGVRLPRSQKFTKAKKCDPFEILATLQKDPETSYDFLANKYNVTTSAIFAVVERARKFGLLPMHKPHARR